MLEQAKQPTGNVINLEAIRRLRIPPVDVHGDKPNVPAVKSNIAYQEAHPLIMLRRNEVQRYGRRLTEQEKRLSDRAYEAKLKLKERGHTFSDPIILPHHTFIAEDPFIKTDIPIQNWREIAANIEKTAASELHRGIYLFNQGAKRVIKNGMELFEDDQAMQEFMLDLRQDARIQSPPYFPATTRFYVSPYEIEREIIPKYSERIGDITGTGEVGNTRLIELVAGNMIKPDLIKGSISMWLGADEIDGRDIRFYLKTESGKPASINSQWMDARSPIIGFNPRVAFYY